MLLPVRHLLLLAMHLQLLAKECTSVCNKVFTWFASSLAIAMRSPWWFAALWHLQVWFASLRSCHFSTSSPHCRSTSVWWMSQLATPVGSMGYCTPLYSKRANWRLREPSFTGEPCCTTFGAEKPHTVTLHSLYLTMGAACSVHKTWICSEHVADGSSFWHLFRTSHAVSKCAHKDGDSAQQGLKYWLASYW